MSDEYDSFYDPYWDGGAKKINETAAYKGRWLGKSHYPDSVVTGTEELRHLAQRICKAWWDALKKSGRDFDYDEVSRLYANAFVAAYRKGVEAETPYEVRQEREKQLAQTGGAKATIQKTEYHDDRVIYQIVVTDGLHFTTPTKSVTFEIHLDSSGNILN